MADEQELDLSAGLVPHPPVRASLAKYQGVTMQDGTRATVKHLVNGMQTARIRTEDGRNITVARKTLQPAEPIKVTAHTRSHPDGKHTVKVSEMNGAALSRRRQRDEHEAKQKIAAAGSR